MHWQRRYSWETYRVALITLKDKWMECIDKGDIVGRLFLDFRKAFEPPHEISSNVVCATNKASDQPAPTRSLIRAFASRFNILWVLSYWLNTICSF